MRIRLEDRLLQCSSRGRIVQFNRINDINDMFDVILWISRPLSTVLS